MKVIFAWLDPENVYKLVLSDGLLSEIAAASRALNNSGYDGELWIYTEVRHLNTKTDVPCTIEVGKDRVGASVLTWEEEDLLEYKDDLLALPVIYLTRRFRVMEQDTTKHLSESDLQLVALWHSVQGDLELKIS